MQAHLERTRVITDLVPQRDQARDLASLELLILARLFVYIISCV